MIYIHSNLSPHCETIAFQSGATGFPRRDACGRTREALLRKTNASIIIITTNDPVNQTLQNHTK